MENVFWAFSKNTAMYKSKYKCQKFKMLQAKVEPAKLF